MSKASRVIPRASAIPVAAARHLPFAAAVIVLLTLLAYAPAMNALFIWDDDAYVTLNPLLNDLDGLRRMWIPRETPQYYPLVFTTFWIEHKIWKMEPAGYHIINILLHSANALLVWRLCRVLKIPGGAIAAWLVGAVFALHPVCVESVAWITERKNVLSGFFYLLAALCYLRFDQADPPAEPGAKGIARWRWYGAALGLFALALLSKTVAGTLPAALILMMLWQRKRLTMAQLVPLLPLFVLGLAMGLYTAVLEREHVGATGEDFAFSIPDRFLIATRALLFYPGKIVLPWPLVFIYPRWAIDDHAIAQYWSVALVAVIGIGAIIAFVRGWRGPALALAFYAGTVFPALGFANIYPMAYSFVADHFQYLACLGVIVLLIGGLAWLLQDARALVAAAVVLLPVFLTLTVFQAANYRDPETLWRHTLSNNNASWMAHNNLSSAILLQGTQAKARGEQQNANALFADGFNHLCMAMDMHARLRIALIEKDPNMQRIFAAYLQREGRHTEAVKELQALVQRQPEDLNARLALGEALEKAGHPQQAVEAYRQATDHVQSRSEMDQIRQKLAPALEALATAHAAAGRLNEAAQTASDAAALFHELHLEIQATQMAQQADQYRAAAAQAPK